MALSASCKVYIAFSDGPLVASPTWTEVTAYVRNVRTSRGRSTELDDFQSGSATIVLDNRGRRFDPDYSSGPYYGNLLPRKQVKVECVYSGVTYGVFRGLVQSWQQDFPLLGRDATTTVQASDLFSLFAMWELADSAHEIYVRSLSPAAWWPLDSADGLTSRVGLQTTATTIPSGATETDSLVVNGAGAIRFAGRGADLAASISSSTTTTISFFVADAPHGETAGLVSLRYPSGYLFAQSEQSMIRAVFTGSATLEIYGGHTEVGTRHVVLARNGTTLTLYVDGVSVGSSTNAGATNSTTFSQLTLSGTDSGGTILDEVAVWTSVLSTTQIASLASAGLYGWAGDTASERMQRLLDILGVPSGLYSLGSASAVLGAHTGGDALSVLQTCARSDGGRLFCSNSGVVTFQARTADMGAASAATFADDATANAVRYSGFALELDDRLIYNVANVSGVNAAADAVQWSAEDSTSITSYSRRTTNISTLLPTEQTCRDYATRTVSRFASPATRGRSWLVHPQRQLIGSTTLGWATVMGRELGDVVTVKRTPTTGTAISKTVQISSIVHDIDLPSGSWTVTFTATPAYTTASFRWGTSNWDGTDYWS